MREKEAPAKPARTGPEGQPRRKATATGRSSGSGRAAIASCSLCREIADRSWARWKAGLLLADTLPRNLRLLRVLGAPYFDTDTSHPNHCLLECPECKTVYAWRFNYEHRVDGSEDEITLTRLSHPDGTRRTALAHSYIRKLVADFAEKAPAHVEALLGAPRHPVKVDRAARFFAENRRKGCDITQALPALTQALAVINRNSDAFVTIMSTLSALGAQDRQRLDAVREAFGARGLEKDPHIQTMLAGCENTLRANCPVCRALPDSITFRNLSAEFPEAARRIEPIGPHMRRCPNCRTYFYMEWDDAPFVDEANSDKMLFRLHPEQSDIVTPFFESPSPEVLDGLAFYLEQMQLTGEDISGRVQAVLLALLCTFTTTVADLRKLAYRSLERFVKGGPERAGRVLDLLDRYDEVTWRARIDKTAPEIQGLVWRCEAVLQRRAAAGGDKRKTRTPLREKTPEECLFCGAPLKPGETICRACLPEVPEPGPSGSINHG